MNTYCFEDLEQYKCEKCLFLTHFRVHLKNHFELTHRSLNTDHNLPGLHRGYTCRKCQLKTHTIFVLTRHRKKDLFECEKCGWQTCSQRNSTRHSSNECREVSAEIKWYECEQCFYQTTKLKHLEQHILREHSPPDGIQSFKCPHCPRKLLTWALLFRHIQEKHVFRCPHCPSEFARRNTLKKHLISWHLAPEEIKWFECDQCCFRTKHKYNLERHKVQHAVERFKCEQCSFEALHKRTLRYHNLKCHTDIIEWLKCALCEYKTVLKSRLTEHFKVKHGDKRFQCDQCPYKTTRKYNLQVHLMKIHNSS